MSAVFHPKGQINPADLSGRQPVFTTGFFGKVNRIAAIGAQMSRIAIEIIFVNLIDYEVAVKVVNGDAP